MRLIDADALKQSFEEDGHLSGYIEEYIDEQPTIDAEPVRHGRWVKIEGFPCCSECGCSPADWEPKPNNPYGLPPYCHACGAKMDTRLESARGCATCANDGMDMPQCRECIEHLERPWYRSKDGGAE